MIVLRNAAVISLVCVFSQTSIAATILVPTDLPTIQAAVDSAQTGDTVAVMFGRYLEEIRIRDKQVYLIGAGSDSCVIDGIESDTACILVSGKEAQSTLIRGFTFESSEFNYRGGIFISDSASAIIEHCCFTDFWAQEGGGIFVTDCWDTTYVRYNRFHGIKNRSRGAAVSAIHSSLSIVGNLIYNNIGSTPDLHNHNQSVAISLHRCSTEVRSNTIVNNHFAGAAIYSFSQEIFVRSQSTIVDNVIASNGSGVGINFHNSQDFVIQYNDIWNHGQGSWSCDYSGCPGSLSSTNISSDPLLVSPDYLPQAGSPIIGAGSMGTTMGIQAAVVECGGPPPICGNGIRENGEICDDGNTLPGDGCDAQCKCEELRGDVNANGVITSADIISLLNFVFLRGPAPVPCTDIGDVNCSGVSTSADVIYLINYIFKNSYPPCFVCPC